MRYQGRLTKWNDDRGFGFITPNGGGQPVFVHRNDFAAGRRPRGNELVTYELAVDAQKRLNARHVQYVAAAHRRHPPAFGALVASAVALAFFAVLAALAWQGRLSPLVPLMYAVMSALTFAAYRADKAAARRRNWRTKESKLHMLALLGGWPGALLAQRWLRHKSSKGSFLGVFAITVVANVALLAWLQQSGRLLLR